MRVQLRYLAKIFKISYRSQSHLYFLYSPFFFSLLKFEEYKYKIF